MCMTAVSLFQDLRVNHRRYIHTTKCFKGSPKCFNKNTLRSLFTIFNGVLSTAYGFIIIKIKRLFLQLNNRKRNQQEVFSIYKTEN